MIYFIHILWHIWYYKTAAIVLNSLFSHPVHWDSFFNWRNNPLISLSKILVIKLHIIVISLLWTRRMKLGTWLCNDGRTRRPWRCTWMRAAAITAVAFASPAGVSGGRLCPSPLASCPAPPASLSRCSAQSPDRSTYPDPVRRGLCPPNSQPSRPPRRRVSCQLDYPEASGSASQPPRARSAPRLVLKLNNCVSGSRPVGRFWFWIFEDFEILTCCLLHRYDQLSMHMRDEFSIFPLFCVSSVLLVLCLLKGLTTIC